ncbi:MAG: formate dehydrogenase accessory sulfurtransferase FdhD [Chloroflexi bacterium]|nr:formate dehydrogenase accessory sulfurtransferase FdhD [Chloroflexota bacterium]
MNEKPAQPITYVRVERNRKVLVKGHVVAEVPLCLRVHGEPWVTLMCSPHDVEALVLGFLRSEGLIHGPEDVVRWDWAQEGRCVDVYLSSAPTALPRRPTLTTGCVGGVTFEDLEAALPPVEARARVDASRLMELMARLLRSARTYRLSRGIHSSALSDGETLRLLAEDVGRHNTLDRLWGQAMRAGLDPQGHILLTTGRISTEMLRKAAKMGVPLIASRTSPTHLALQLAEAWHITVVGYVRPTSLRVYTHPERVKGGD